MQREMAVGIGRVADGKVEMGRPGEDPLPVRERLEAPLAVVASHAAVADASEGELGNDHVHDDVVDAGVARARPVDDLVLRRLVVREQVERERLGTVRHELDRRVHARDGEHRQDGPEDLILHDRRLGRHAPEDRRRDVSLLGLGLAPADDLAVVEQLRQPLKVAVVDDPAVVRADSGVVAVEGGHRRPQVREELELDRLVHQHVVGCHAGLAGVAEPAPGDPPGGDLERCVAVDQARRLAAELEDDGGEVLGGLLEHDLADAAAAREEDEVESLVQERLGLLGPPLDHRDGLRVEVARHQVRHEGGGVGRDLRRLQDRRIAAGQRAHQGRQEQVDGIVPGADDEDHAEGVVGGPGPPGLGQERRVLPLRPHPPFEVLRARRRSHRSRSRPR